MNVPIHIEEIYAKNQGPISEFNHKLGIINLIYGHNEKGKTCLVEFLIRSLFKSTKDWRLRSFTGGEGRVLISGIKDELISLSPSSPKKFADFLDDAGQNFPVDISKLLIVKAAEVELSENRTQDIDKDILKQYLSGVSILDSIEQSISQTIKQSTIQRGEVIGDNRGEIKTLAEKKEELERISRKLYRVNEDYSEGKLLSLINQRNLFSKKLDEFDKAKRHLAYLTDQNVSKLKNEIEKIPRESLNSIRDNLTKTQQKKEDLKDKIEQHKEAKNKSEHYEWLKQAVDILEKYNIDKLPKQRDIFLILGVFTSIITLFLLFLNQRELTLISLVLALGFFIYYIFNLRSFTSQVVKSEEFIKIEKAFKKRFNKDFDGLTDLKVLKEQIERDYHLVLSLSDDITRLKSELGILGKDISALFFKLVDKEIKEDKWEIVYKQLEERHSVLDDQIHQEEKVLTSLDVDPKYFYIENVQIKFDKSAYEEITKKIGELDHEIEAEKGNLNSLKQSICDETKDDISSDWEDLIHNLEKRREEFQITYKDLKASVIAKIYVYKVLNDIRAKEEDKIRERLKSDYVLEPLIKMTDRYNKIDLIDDQLIVSDLHNDYLFNDLSTGAKEQIFLALRIGFASRIVQEKELFFILDDAFQYSDWDRRLLLVDKMIDLAKNNWQIIYFSMDDNIRDIFISKASKEFKDQFMQIDLD